MTVSKGMESPAASRARMSDNSASEPVASTSSRSATASSGRSSWLRTWAWATRPRRVRRIWGPFSTGENGVRAFEIADRGQGDSLVIQPEGLCATCFRDRIELGKGHPPYVPVRQAPRREAGRRRAARPIVRHQGWSGCRPIRPAPCGARTSRGWRLGWPGRPRSSGGPEAPRARYRRVTGTRSWPVRSEKCFERSRIRARVKYSAAAA